MKKHELVLNYVGYDSMSGPVYKTDNDIYFVDNYGTLLYLGSKPDVDPLCPVSSIDEYKDTEFVLKGNNRDADEKYRFKYMLLSRLEQDCKYFLGFGNRSENTLWGENTLKHINKMRKVYSCFPDDKKPNWLTPQEIDNYEKQMLSKQDVD